MNKFFTIITLCLLTLTANAKSRRVTITTTQGAHIFLNGLEVGASTTNFLMYNDGTNFKVRVEKVGFIPQERNYKWDPKAGAPPSSDFIELEVDDAYESSMTTNTANHDIDIRTSNNEEDSWKLLSRIITNSFDVIQVTDKSTGYMCTAWVVKNFKSATVRTRLILKTASSEPLAYKIKLVSEIASAGTSANADEQFRPWDRLLRTFENVVPDLQSRLAK